MNNQETLSAFIEVKGITTTVDKYLYFKQQLRNLCNQTFDDPTYIYNLLQTQLFESMTTKDKGLVDYELVCREEQFHLRMQNSLSSRKRK